METSPHQGFSMMVPLLGSGHRLSGPDTHGNHQRQAKAVRCNSVLWQSWANANASVHLWRVLVDSSVLCRSEVYVQINTLPQSSQLLDSAVEAKLWTCVHQLSFLTNASSTSSCVIFSFKFFITWRNSNSAALMKSLFVTVGNFECFDEVRYIVGCRCFCWPHVSLPWHGDQLISPSWLSVVSREILQADCSVARHEHLDLSSWRSPRSASKQSPKTSPPPATCTEHFLRPCWHIPEWGSVSQLTAFAERFGPQICCVFHTLDSAHSKPVGSHFILHPQICHINVLHSTNPLSLEDVFGGPRINGQHIS